MKITIITSALIISIGQCNVMNSLKISDAVKGTVFSAAGKFLNGKSTKTAPVAPAATAEKTSSKSSRMGQILDVGTNVAMAVAGAGTLFQALSSGPPSEPATPPPYVVCINFSLYVIYLIYYRLFSFFDQYNK